MRNNSKETSKNFYRNKKPVSADGITIDEGSLWELLNGLMVLSDDDQYITMVPSTNFVAVED
jgi:hypothetical protein